MRFAPGGLRYAGIAVVLAVPALFVSVWISLGLLGAATGLLWFYRDPDRAPPPTGIVSPADGRVRTIREADGRIHVAVVMRLRDVHVNRAPLGGTVAALDHVAGANRPAFSKESANNERVRITFDDYETILIAGWFARRITPYIGVGDRVERGERIGHIAFGSRADVFLPPSVAREAVRVEEGMGVTAGETVIAPEPSGREHSG